MLNLVSYGRPREIAVRQKAVTDQAELRRNAPEQTRLMLLKPLPENASALFIRSGTVQSITGIGDLFAERIFLSPRIGPEFTE
jgi:hypothetical protein